MLAPFDAYGSDSVAPARQGIAAASAKWLGAALSVALLVGTAYWTYRLGQRDAFAVPIIQAMAGPAKVQPDDPGGLEAEHQGLSVNQVMEGTPPPPRPARDAVQLAPAAAEPAEEDKSAEDLIPIVRAEAPAQALPPAADPPVVAARQPVAPEAPPVSALPGPEAPQPASPAPRTLAAPSAQPVPLAEARPVQADPLPAPKPVPPQAAAVVATDAPVPTPPAADPVPRTVAADPIPAPTEAAVPPYDPVPAAAAPLTAEAAGTEPPESLVPTSFASKTSARPPQRPKPPAPARTAAAAEATAPVVATALPDPVPQAAPAATPAPEVAAAPLTPTLAPRVTAAKPPEPADAPAKPPGKGAMLIQLGAFESPEVAKREWKKLIGQHGDLLGRKAAVVQKTVSSGRTFYRLRAAGFEDLADARATCAALTARGPACIPARQD